MPALVEILVVSPNQEQRFVTERNGTITVGRSPDCQVVLDESTIGQCQVRLDWASDDELTLALAAGREDLETRGGVILEGESVDLPVILTRSRQTLPKKDSERRAQQIDLVSPAPGDIQTRP